MKPESAGDDPDDEVATRDPAAPPLHGCPVLSDAPCQEHDGKREGDTAAQGQPVEGGEEVKLIQVHVSGRHLPDAEDLHADSGREGGMGGWLVSDLETGLPER